MSGASTALSIILGKLGVSKDSKPGPAEAAKRTEKSPYTIEEAASDRRRRYLAQQNAYPPESEVAKKFHKVLEAVAERLVEHLPEELKVIEAKDLAFYLLSSDEFDAHTVSGFPTPAPVSFSTELIRFCLAVESDDYRGIDVLAAFACHELMHNIYRRKYPDQENTKVQETFCDQVAGTLFRAGFHPDAMNALFKRCEEVKQELTGEPTIEYECVYLTDELREEVYQVSALPYSVKADLLDQEEVNRFKDLLEADLTGIYLEVAEEQVENFLVQYLKDRQYFDLSTVEKIEYVNDIFEQYEDYLNSTGGTNEAVSLFCILLSDLKADSQSDFSASEFQAPFNQLSANLYLAIECPQRMPLKIERDLYQEFRKVLGAGEHFGLFKEVNAKAERFLNAETEEEFQSAYAEITEYCQELKALGIDLIASGEEGKHNIVSNFIVDEIQVHARGSFVNSIMAEQLLAGEAVPLPFREHEKYWASQDAATQSYNIGILRTVFAAFGVVGIISELGVKDSALYNQFYDSTSVIRGLAYEQLGWAREESSVDKQLCKLCKVPSIAAFSIDLDDGIRLEYPNRYTLQKHEYSSGIEKDDFFSLEKAKYIDAEVAYLNSMIERSDALIPEVDKLTEDTIFDFVDKHGDFLVPQLRLDFDELRGLHAEAEQLARVFVDKVAELLAESSDPDFQDKVKDLFLFHKSSQHAGDSDCCPLACATSWQVYREYHSGLHMYEPQLFSISRDNPFVCFLRENHGELFSSDEVFDSLVALSSHRLENNYFGTFDTIEPIAAEVSHLLEPEVSLAELFGVSADLPPGEFITDIKKIESYGDNWIYLFQEVNDRGHVSGINNSSNLRLAVRSVVVSNYLQETNYRLSIEDLHQLYCLNANSKAVGLGENVIHRHLEAYCEQEYLSNLSDEDLLKHFQIIHSMGHFANKSVDRMLYESEITRRIEEQEDLDRRDALVSELIFPQVYYSLDVGSGHQSYQVSSFKSYFPKSERDPDTIVAMYALNTVRKSFQDFVVKEAVAMFKRRVVTATDMRLRDNDSDLFYNAIEGVVQDMDDRGFRLPIRRKILTQLADELETQERVSYHIRDNLTGKEDSELTADSIFDLLDNLSSIDSKSLNKVVGSAEELFDTIRSDAELRQAVFAFLANPCSPLFHDHLEEVSQILDRNTKSYEIVEGIAGKTVWFSREKAGQMEILRNLHLRYSALSSEKQGLILSLFAHDRERQTEQEFQNFKETVLFPNLIPAEMPNQDLLRDFIDEYFALYKDNTYQKYVVACSFLAAKNQSGNEGLSPEAYFGKITGEFLQAHGDGGENLCQKIHSSPDTPPPMAEQLAESKSRPNYMPRWDYFNLLKENGPPAELNGAKRVHVGKVHAGKMGVSSKMRYADGTETQVVVLKPGAEENSTLWLGKFKNCLENLGAKYPFLQPYVPLVEQTQELIQFESDFEETNRLQQQLAEAAYSGVRHSYPNYDVVIRPMALLRSANNRSGDPGRYSGYKESEHARGVSYNQFFRQLQRKGEQGTLKEAHVEIASNVASSVFAAQTANNMSIKRNNQDVHGDNLKMTIRYEGREKPEIQVQLFDFGCVDPREISEAEKHATSRVFYDTFGKLSLLRGGLGRQFISEFSRGIARFHRENDLGETPFLDSLPISYLALGDIFRKLEFDQPVPYQLRDGQTQSKKSLAIMTVGSLLDSIRQAARQAEIDHSFLEEQRGLKFWLFTKLLSKTSAPE